MLSNESLEVTDPPPTCTRDSVRWIWANVTVTVIAAVICNVQVVEDVQPDVTAPEGETDQEETDQFVVGLAVNITVVPLT